MHILPPATPRPLDPGSSYAEPFELLDACHARLARSLDLLQRLCAHAATAGADAHARSAAADVLRYFDIAAPLHHEDEERHVFPALEAAGPLAAVCARLRVQHGEITQHWQALREPLSMLAAGQLPELADLTASALAFARRHDEHLRAENELVFPAARQALDTAQRHAIGIEMAARRGLDLRPDLRESAAPGNR